jgi:hypothetical protein
LLGEYSPREIMKPTFKIPSFPDEIEDWWWKQTIQKWPELSEEKSHQSDTERNCPTK